MTDVFDKKTRRRIMRAVRTSGTEPEEHLASALKSLGLQFRRNDSDIEGTPDFSFRRMRLAVFVDGDFWHGRLWIARRVAPKTNTDFWVKKFEANRQHDLRVNSRLRRNGWSVVRLWASDVVKEPDAGARRVQVKLETIARKRIAGGLR